ncbi:hypothetical protein ACWELQ_17820, partial [Nocardia sp. NPDC004722]
RSITNTFVMPADQAVVLRMMLLVMATIGHLRATGDWHGMLREWLHGDAPTTPLGLLDQEFRSGTAIPTF